MTIYPCRDCRFNNNCDLKTAKVASVRGLGLTSIKFTCKKRKDDLAPGMVVRANLPAVCVGVRFHADEEDHHVIEPSTLTAVVMGWNASKKVLIGFIDTDQPVRQNESGHNIGGFLLTRSHQDVIRCVNVNPKYLEPTGEIVAVCRNCGKPKDATWEGWTCQYVGEDQAVMPCVYDSAKAGAR